MEDLKRQLFERFDENLAGYKASLLKMDAQDIIAHGPDIAATYETYTFMKTQFEYREGEIEALLELQNPLEYLAGEWLHPVSEVFDIDFDIIEGIQAIDEHPEYQRTSKGPDRPDPAYQSLKQRLFARLDENLDEFNASMINIDKPGIIDNSRDIAAAQDAHKYLKTKYRYEDGEVEALLELQNPLKYLADKWPYPIFDSFETTVREDVREVISYIDEHPDLPRVTDAQEKASLLGQLRQKAQEVRPPDNDKGPKAPEKGQR